MTPQDRRAALFAAADERILILDGAMGTMIQAEKPDEATYRGERFRDHPVDVGGDNELLTLTRPGMIRAIHAAFLDAGADIVCTNTFSATRIRSRRECCETVMIAAARRATSGRVRRMVRWRARGW